MGTGKFGPGEIDPEAVYTIAELAKATCEHRSVFYRAAEQGKLEIVDGTVTEAALALWIGRFDAQMYGVFVAWTRVKSKVRTVFGLPEGPLPEGDEKRAQENAIKKGILTNTRDYEGIVRLVEEERLALGLQPRVVLSS